MKNQLFIPSSTDSLSRVRKWVSQVAIDAGFRDAFQQSLMLAVDEACSNVVEHAYPNTEDGIVELTCLTSYEYIVISIVDEGKSFESQDYVEPDLASFVLNRKDGGFGIKLINMLVDNVEYRIRNQRNELRLVKYRPKLND